MDNIWFEVVQLFDNFRQEQKWTESRFLFVDANANQGNLTKNLIDKYPESSIVSVSRQEDNFGALRRTTRNDPRIITQQSLNQVPNNWAGSILMIQNIEAGDIKEEDFISLEGRPIEEWFETSRQCALIVYILNRRQVFQQVRDYNWAVYNLREYRVIFALSPYGVGGLGTIGQQVKQFHLSTRIPTTEADLNYRNLITELKEELANIEGDEQWIINKKPKIRAILAQYFIDRDTNQILPNEILNRMTDDQAMRIWLTAFTHQSVDIDNNYENFEIIGDRALEYVFVRYLFKLFPGKNQLDPMSVTDLKMAYMSKPFQAVLSREVGFPELARFYGRETETIAEDLFEAFFGAMLEIGKLMGNQGFYYCSLALEGFFEAKHPGEIKKFFEILRYGNPKTQVNQLFEGLGFTVTAKGKDKGKKDVEPRVDQLDKFQSPKGLYEILIYITSNAVETFRRQKIYFSSQIPGHLYQDVARKPWTNYDAKTDYVLAYGAYGTKKVAEIRAYSEAFRYLESLGITRDWVRLQSRQKDENDPLIRPLVPQVADKLRREGYDDYLFLIPKSSATQNYHLVQLYGVTRNKGQIQRTLLSTAHGKDPTNAKKRALEGYLYKERIQAEGYKFPSLQI